MSTDPQSLRDPEAAADVSFDVDDEDDDELDESVDPELLALVEESGDVEDFSSFRFPPPPRLSVL
jgi:hypothetical protein